MTKPTNEIKVVIIEDDKAKKEELVEILHTNKFSLKNIFSTGFSDIGIDLIEEHLPDVVLLDLKIPANEDDQSVKIENSNKVIKDVELINARRNQDDESTGIIIISASVNDSGLQRLYKDKPEIVHFFDKERITLDPKSFSSDLIDKINIVVARNFRHIVQVDYDSIRNIKIKKLESINKDLFERIDTNLLGQFAKLNNRNVNVHQIVEGIIGLSGKIVEDIVILLEDNDASLSIIDDSDNFNSIRNKLTKLSGRKYDHSSKGNDIIYPEIISRKAADFASYAYKLRSEALHSKEGDIKNDKIFVNSKYSISDAVISIDLIMPLVQEFIIHINKNN